MSVLRTIGNSKGILIPKDLIQKANLSGHELEFELHADGLLIKPMKAARATWKEQVATTLMAHHHDVDHEWLDADLLGQENEDD